MAVVVIIVTLRIIAMRIAVVVASIATNRCRCTRTRHLVPIKLSLHPDQLLGKLLVLFLQISHLFG